MVNKYYVEGRYLNYDKPRENTKDCALKRTLVKKTLTA